MIELRPYQLDLMNRVRAQVTAGNRIIVVQASTGAGKTVWASALTREAVNKGSDVLLMVHRRRLVDQISGTLSDFRVDHGILMRGDPSRRHVRCQVASRDTLLSRCVRNEWVGLPPAKIVIVDEAHHAADPESEYRKILAAYPHAIIILLTATPVGPCGQGLGPWAQAIECAAPTSQLIRDGFLVPLRVYAPERKKRFGKFIRGIAGDLVESWKTYGEERPTLLFVPRVKHSQDAVEAFRVAGISAVHIDADTPDDERDRAFDDVASGRVKVLSNVGIVGEGVDVPELGCCQLFCECGGRVKLMQAAGRIMRTSPGKQYGILIDHAASVFRHGFPDEDMEWTLDGDADAKFKKKHDEGKTEKALYCSKCELVYHGDQGCPQCGRQPVKPPRSIFAPPAQDASNELLTEADRGGDAGVYAKDEKIRHWLRCLGVAAARDGTFSMASVIYKNKYEEYPEFDFPCVVPFRLRNSKVVDLHPEFKRERQQT